MKATFLFFGLIILAVIGHDYWYASTNNLEFAHSDFGWLIQTYMPGLEIFLIDTYNKETLTNYIAPVFKTETIRVIGYVGVFFFGLAFLSAASRGKLLENLKFFSFRRFKKKKKESKKFTHKAL